MVKEVTDALVNSLDITADDVRIELEELQYGMFARAGRLIIEKNRGWQYPWKSILFKQMIQTMK